jgi:hypothetical protein
MFRARECVRQYGFGLVCTGLATLFVAACADDDVAPIGTDAGAKTDGGYQHVIVEKTIAPNVGGTIELPDGPVLTIPPGALPAGSSIRITVETTPTNGPQGTASQVYQFGPEGLTFDKPVPVSIPFELQGRNAADYTIFWSKLGGSGYEDRPTEFADGQATTMVEHFSSAGVRRKPSAVTCVAETSTPRDADNDGVVDGCTCKDGFELRSGVCVDIDECANDNGLCDEHAVCTNTPGGRSCGKCPSGYNGTGDTQCLDINECDANNAGCDSNVECTNTPGSFTCGNCPEGFTGGGRSGCKDVNECESTNACDKLTECTNTPGSYSCSACPGGYTGNGKAGCTDVNECAELHGGCDPLAECTNTPGGHNCGECPLGYVGSPCVDIDECLTNACGSNVECMNSDGSFMCGSCKGGYEDKSGACVDIDECTGDNDCTEQHRQCQNTGGSHTCGDCIDGWAVKDPQGNLCEDINECAGNGSGQTFCTNLHKLCVNQPGNFGCGSCSAGYKPSTESTEAACVAFAKCEDAQNAGVKACAADNKRCANQEAADFQCEACGTDQKADGEGGCTAVKKCADMDNAGVALCADMQKTCADHSDKDFTCDACPSGQKLDPEDGCRAYTTCAADNGAAAMACAEQHKACHDGTSADHSCTTCLDGYKPGANDSCVAVAKCGDNNAAGTAYCESDNKSCVDHPALDYTCEACSAGLIPDGNGACRPIETCVANGGEGVAECAADNKVCEDQANQDYKCGACAPSYKPGESSALPCVPVAKCADDSDAGTAACAQSSQLCVDHSDRDFSCQQCGAGEKFVNNDCVPFAKCADGGAQVCAAAQKACHDHADKDYTCELCADGQLSDGSGGCRAVLTCEANDNAGVTVCDTDHKTCENHQSADYSCSVDCASGFVKDKDGVCVDQAEYDSCAAGEAKAVECAGANRDCVGSAGVAGTCGDCVATYTENTAGVCVLTATYDACANGEALAATCASDHKLCEDGQGPSGTCGDCVQGYNKDAADACVLTATYDACASGEARATECAGLHVVCVDDPSGPGGACGTDCIAGYHKNAAESCVETATFDACAPGEDVATQCAAEYRVCVDGGASDPSGTCGECLPGYNDNNGMQTVCTN